jgi:hypothetical protein
MGKKSKSVWSSKVGRDCVSLDTKMCRWLGKRLSHLAKYSTGVPQDYINLVESMHDEGRDTKFFHKCWKREMSAAGEALTRYGNMFRDGMVKGDVEVTSTVLDDAQSAMRWVAKWLPNLWD